MDFSVGVNSKVKVDLNSYGYTMMVLLVTGDVDEDDYCNGMDSNNNYLDKESNNLSNTDKTIIFKYCRSLTSTPASLFN